MAKKIKYEGFKKSFNVYIKKINMYKETKVIINTLITLLIMLIVFLIMNVAIYGFKIEDFEYSKSSDLQYRVCLFENDDWPERCIDEDNNTLFIENLIDTIEVDFNYENKFNEEMESTYSYSILGEIIIAKNDSLILNRKYDLNKEIPTIINETTELEKIADYILSDELNLSGKLVIDYSIFNDYVSSFTNDYSVNSILKITITLNTNSSNETLNSQILNTNSMYLEIPLNEEYVKITKSGDIYQDESVIISNKAENKIANPYILTVASIIFVGLLIYLIINLYKLYIIIFKKDIYNYTIKKYLREYDRIIITTKQPSIKESDYKNKIRVMSIEELVDAHDNTNNPIIYYEVIPNKKSYFILLDDRTLYKLTISRVYLEEEIKNNIKNKETKKKKKKNKC